MGLRPPTDGQNHNAQGLHDRASRPERRKLGGKNATAKENGQVAEWRACQRCGCYEPFVGKTDLCCYATNGTECVFDDEMTEEKKPTKESCGKRGGSGELRVDMDLTTGYEPEEQTPDVETTPPRGKTKKRRATKEILRDATDRQKGESEKGGDMAVGEKTRDGTRPWEVTWIKKRELNKGKMGRLIKMKLSVNEQAEEMEWGRKKLLEIIMNGGLKMVREGENTDYRDHLFRGTKLTLLSFEKPMEKT